MDWQARRWFAALAVTGALTGFSATEAKAETPDPVKARVLEREARTKLVQGDAEGAMALAARALAIDEATWGTSHLRLTRPLDALAEAALAAGKPDEARKALERALTILETIRGPEHTDVAVVLHRLARIHLDQKRDAEAEVLLGRILSIHEKRLGGYHLTVAQSISELADLSLAKGDLTGAEKRVLRALKIRQVRLGRVDILVARSLMDLADLHLRQGRQGRALPLISRALAILEKKLGPEHPDVVEPLEQLADLHEVMGKPNKSEPLLARALAISERALGSDDPALVPALDRLALIYIAQNRLEEAEPLLVRGLALREAAAGPEDPQIAPSLDRLAALRTTQGRFDDAETLIERALNLRRTHLGDEHPELALSLDDKGRLRRAQGRYEEAEALFRESLTLREKVLGERHVDVSRSLFLLADLLTARQRLTEARDATNRALGIQEASLGDKSAAMAPGMGALADSLMFSGRPDEAEVQYKRALSVVEKQLGNDDPRVAQALTRAADASLVQGTVGMSEFNYRRALGIFERAGRGKHLDAAPTLGNLGFLLQSQWKLPQAEPFLRRAASIHENSNTRLPGGAVVLKNLASLYATIQRRSEALELLQRAAVIEATNIDADLACVTGRGGGAYTVAAEGAAGYALSLHLRDDPDSEPLARFAADQALRLKGRAIETLDRPLERLWRHTTADNRPSLVQLEEARCLRAELRLDPDVHGAPETVAAALNKLETRIEALENTLGPKSRRMATGTISVSAVSAALPQDGALVEYITYRPFDPRARRAQDRWGEPRLAAYAVRSGDALAWADLGPTKAIVDEVARFNALLAECAGGGQCSEPEAKERAGAVYALLVAPIEAHLEGASKWWVAPTAPVSSVPWEGLVDASGQYILQKAEVARVISGRDLLRPEVEAPSESPLVFADPDYNFAGQGPAPQRSGGLAGMRWEPTHDGVEALSAVEQAVAEARVFVGSEASESALHDARGPIWLHLSTRAWTLSPPTGTGGAWSPRALTHFMGPLAPWRLNRPTEQAGLVLAGASAGTLDEGRHDGILGSFEIPKLDLAGTRMVMLSLEGQKPGDKGQGEGLMILGRVFEMAGAARVVAVSWDVPLAVRQAVLSGLYAGMARGDSPTAALRGARLEMLGGQWSHPAYWAGLSVYGAAR